MYENLYQLPEYDTMFARKNIFLPNWGRGWQLPSLPSASYAYDL